MIAAMVLTPALGYTGQSGGNQSYTAISAARVAYSISSGVPAHNLTQEMVASKYSIRSPAVQGSRVPYSLQGGAAVPYSAKLVGVSNAVPEGIQVKPEIARAGEAKPAENEQIGPAPEENKTVVVPENVTPVVPVEQPKFSIAGVVFDDVNGNGVMEANEVGLANWTVNLEQPAGTVIESAATTMDGKFAFLDLAAGEYTVSEVMQMGWNLIAPADNKITVTITNASVSDLAFANQMIPVVEPVTTENVTELINDTLNKSV
ncbi:SdrD B-like domain protein [uncultured archaeon]|nr:SdrD B-like domain protein [uncultured archaeon]